MMAVAGGSDRGRRSPSQWAARIVLAAIAAVLAYFTVTFSLAQAVMKAQPELAHNLAPYDGRITAALADALITADMRKEDRARSEALARLALRQDPMAVAAIPALGFGADLRGETATSRRLFTYAQKISRRNLKTQLWMIEDLVRREDVAGALSQYDTTLRVFPQVADILFPILAAASNDPEIRPELVKLLARKPVWADSFIIFAVARNPEPGSVPGLLNSLADAGAPVSQAARARAVDRLLNAKKLDEAWAYYAAMRPGVDRRRLRDPGFTADLGNPTQLDWILVGDGAANATLQRGLFDFNAPASAGGPLLQQTQLLPPGNYRLTGHSLGVEQPAGSKSYWVLVCQDGRELGRVALPSAADAKGVFSGTFGVPRECAVQTLALVAGSSDTASAPSIQIDRVTLSPAGEGGE